MVFLVVFSHGLFVVFSSSLYGMVFGHQGMPFTIDNEEKKTKDHVKRHHVAKKTDNKKRPREKTIHVHNHVIRPSIHNIINTDSAPYMHAHNVATCTNLWSSFV